MLVLARRLHEKIILPALNMTIQVVALQSNMVRLGIEAPRNLEIYREEVYDRATAVASAEPDPISHDVRNRLNNLGLNLALLQRQFSSQLSPDARKSLEQAQLQYAALRDQLQTLLEQNAPIGREPQLTA